MKKSREHIDAGEEKKKKEEADRKGEKREKKRRKPTGKVRKSRRRYVLCTFNAYLLLRNENFRQALP